MKQPSNTLAWVITAILGGVFAVAIIVVIWLVNKPTAGEQTEGLQVTGEGRVSAVPDIAQVDVGVETRADDANTASQENNRISDAIIAAIKGLGIKDTEIQTINLSIYPDVSYDSAGQEDIRGYLASNNVQVKIKDLEKAPTVVSTALGAGATNIQGVYFTFSDETKTTLEQQARQNAIEDAQQRAQELATLGNVRLGEIIDISESSDNFAEPVYMEGADIGTGGGAAIEPGSSEITVNVTVRFELE